jgi:hypothetical protein
MSDFYPFEIVLPWGQRSGKKLLLNFVFLSLLWYTGEAMPEDPVTFSQAVVPLAAH